MRLKKPFSMSLNGFNKSEITIDSKECNCQLWYKSNRIPMEPITNPLNALAIYVARLETRETCHKFNSNAS